MARTERASLTAFTNPGTIAVTLDIVVSLIPGNEGNMRTTFSTEAWDALSSFLSSLSSPLI